MRDINCTMPLETEEYVNDYKMFSFDFGNAKLTFISTALARLSWNERKYTTLQVLWMTRKPIKCVMCFDVVENEKV